MPNKSNKNIKLKKKVTSIDVAREAGVSQTMVSFVLNNVKDVSIKPETRQKVLEAARKLNYQMNYNARTMRSNKAFAIGLMIDWMSQSTVFQECVSAAKIKCEKDDIALILCTGAKGSENTEDYIRYYNQSRIDGLIYVTYIDIDHGVLDKIKRSGIPFVCIKAPIDYEGTAVIDTDYFHQGYTISKHMAEQGYKKIAFISDNFDYSRMDYGWRQRYDGVKQAIKDSGKNDITFIEGLLPAAISTLRPEKENVDIALDFLKSHDVDAIIDISSTCNTFISAAKLLDIKVPQELGLASYDDNGAAKYSYPSITTMHECYTQEMEYAYDLLQKKINGETPTDKIRVKSEFNIGDSSKRI